MVKSQFTESEKLAVRQFVGMRAYTTTAGDGGMQQ